MSLKEKIGKKPPANQTTRAEATAQFLALSKMTRENFLTDRLTIYQLARRLDGMTVIAFSAIGLVGYLGIFFGIYSLTH